MSSKKEKKPKHKHSADRLRKGHIEITRSGMGYVVIADEANDIMIRPQEFNTALNGDIVRVKIIKENHTTGKREGKIVEVIQRKQTEFIGTLQLSTNFGFVIIDGDKSMPDLYVPLEKLNGGQNKDRVAVKLVKWDKEDKKPVGEVISVLAAEAENHIAMKRLLVENGFPLSFSNEAIEDAQRFPDAITKAEIKKRKDCRDILTFTIDPVDAKDFDDAISIRYLKNDLYEIGVHIADVSHYVEENTVLDDEAYQRATSVYLPDRVNPMLPERISNELCSLRPHEDKLTFSAIFQMNAKGEIKQYWLGKTIIHSNHRFTYEEVQDIIESSEGLHKEEIILLNNIAQKLRKKRFSKGAINFSSQEVRFKLDENGKPIGIIIKESKEAHQLIEEFMLLANRTVAENISKIKVNKKQLPFPYRIHDVPDEQKLKPFIEFAKKYGHKFNTDSPEKIAASFNQMLQDVEGKPEQHVLEQLGIRTMAKAVYSTENIGHYGLAFPYYSHFTSPIRRYPDILVHRILQSVLNEKIVVDKKLAEKCKHCSERERAAMDVERAANKYKQVEYLKDYIGHEFEAVVSGVAGFGFWAETVEHKCEGLISVASLSEYDDFRLIETDYSLVGLRSGRRFRIGDRIWIKLIAANLEKRQLDFEWVLKPNQEHVTPEEVIINKEKVKKKKAVKKGEKRKKEN